MSNTTAKTFTVETTHRDSGASKVRRIEAVGPEAACRDALRTDTEQSGLSALAYSVRILGDHG